jgi:hypothetical protein
MQQHFFADMANPQPQVPQSMKDSVDLGAEMHASFSADDVLRRGNVDTGCVNLQVYDGFGKAGN